MYDTVWNDWRKNMALGLAPRMIPQEQFTHTFTKNDFTRKRKGRITEAQILAIGGTASSASLALSYFGGYWAIFAGIIMLSANLLVISGRFR
jgi:hypothetical protein